jgi:HD-GYP domain-containing protein (c-di-GMP phosphodiesterase class II)
MASLPLADLVAALSQVTDLGMGQPPETAVRSCLVATSLARAMGVPEGEIMPIYYTTLLQHLGCTAYAHETAALVDGDDIAFRAAGARFDDTRPREMAAFLLTGVARGSSPPARARSVLHMLRAGSSFGERLYRANCEVAVRTAGRVGLPAGVQAGLDQIYTRWDGKGLPAVRGDEIALAARFAQLGGQAALFHAAAGVDLAIEMAQRRSGATLDPAIVDSFVRHGREIFARIDATDPTAAVIAEEPSPPQTVPEPHLDEVAHAFGDMVDLKSPWLHGHASGVARLAEATAAALGRSAAEITAIRRAGYLHDIGRAGVASGIWDKPGPLTAAEWEQVRLHPYYAERVLARSRMLEPLAQMAGMHHERLDGSGYYRQAAGTAIPNGARILAAADAWHAMTSDRPHRRALAPNVAATQLLSDARQGRLDAVVVDALLAVAGQGPPPRERAWPAGLTDREVEVLRLAARGLTNRQIGEALSISPKTADHHVQHIYTKIDVSTRAGAAIYAMEHNLLDTGPGPEMG